MRLAQLLATSCRIEQAPVVWEEAADRLLEAKQRVLDEAVETAQTPVLPDETVPSMAPLSRCVQVVQTDVCTFVTQWMIDDLVEGVSQGGLVWTIKPGSAWTK